MRLKQNIAVLSVCVAVGLGLVLYFKRPASPKSKALAQRERIMELLGAQIAKLRPKSTILVLSNPYTKTAGRFDEKTQFERAGIRGLEKGLGENSKVTVAFPDIRAEYRVSPEVANIPPDSRTPLSFLMRGASVDELADANRDCNVIVSLIGLPVGVQELKLWNEADSRSFALLLPDLRVIGQPAEVIQAFKRGKLLAAVFEDPKSENPLVVTRENIAELLQREPRLLGF